MNEFVLKEKHKYWDNKITLEEYIKETEKCGYIECYRNSDYEYWYILENLKKLNVLEKEDKSQEIPQFKGTMKQLDDLCNIRKEEK